MGAQGTTTIDFGAFPGKTDATATITGQASILSGSLVEAWIFPVATADHTADEHMLETFKVFAGNVSAGVGFTIYGFVSSELSQRPAENAGQGAGPRVAATGGPALVRGSAHAAGKQDNTHRGSRLYGLYTVAWVWN
jgi:hypothetical protein